MMNGRLYLDLHVLQTVPPSCINRDDTGSPKSAIYGGVQRARVSSQAWKKAMRDMFRELFDSSELGVRSKRIDEMVTEDLLQLDPSYDAEQAKTDAKAAVEVVLKYKKDILDTLFFLSRAQSANIAALIAEDPQAFRRKTPSADTKKAVEDALRCSPSVDIALFGRMVASDPTLNTDACAQVAHAISTHAVSTEFDYFTAVDDLMPEDNAGAAHLGVVEFNSSTLYRYATLAIHELERTQGDRVGEIVRGFVESFVRSMPTGKQNTFANRTLPEALFVVLRSDQPLNLVGAFEAPVIARDKGYFAGSAAKMVAHTKMMYETFASRPLESFVVGESLAELGDTVSLAELLDILPERVKDLRGETEVC